MGQATEATADMFDSALADLKRRQAEVDSLLQPHLESLVILQQRFTKEDYYPNADERHLLASTVLAYYGQKRIQRIEMMLELAAIIRSNKPTPALPDTSTNQDASNASVEPQLPH